MNLKDKPDNHRWHASFRSGELCYVIILNHENYKCTDCGVEISYCFVVNDWVLGHSGDTKFIGVSIPSCEEGKMQNALE